MMEQAMKNNTFFQGLLTAILTVLVLLSGGINSRHANADEAKEETKTLFRDDFEGEYIKDDWEIIKPNPDTAIVEDGMLQILTELPKESLFAPPNMLLWKTELPKQYEIVLKMRITMIDRDNDWTENQLAGLLLYNDPQNVTGLAAASFRNYAEGDFDTVQFFKVRNKTWVPGFYAKLGPMMEDREVTVKLKRIKRKFFAYYLDDKGQWQEIGEFPELRPKYRLAVFAARGSSGAREALEKFDWIEIKEIQHSTNK